MGRKPKKEQKTVTTEQSKQSKTVIVDNVTKPYGPKEEPRRYYCQSCGRSFNTQNKNFPTTQSPMFAGNGGYTNMCKRCTDKWYDYYTKTFGDNEEKAMDRMAALFDWYYSDKIMDMVINYYNGSSRVCGYPAKMNLPQYNTHPDKSAVTYLDTIKDRANLTAYNAAQTQNQEDDDPLTVPERLIKKWGMSYTKEEYPMLEEHYRLYKDSIDEDNPTQVALLRDLCDQHILKTRAKNLEKMDVYEKISKLYQQTLATANLKVRDKNADNSPDECWGNFNQLIEKYTPAEYFADKKIFKDYDEMDEYYQRFIARPTNNLINGSSNEDEEFRIKPDDENE